MRLQDSRESHQHRIAGRMAVAVVEILEVVQVEGQHGQRKVAPFAARYLPTEGFGQVAPIEQAGERVANRQVAQALPKLQVGQGQGQLIGSRDRHLELGNPGVAWRAQVDPAQRLALREQGYACRAEAGAIVPRNEMGAGTVRCAAPAQVHALVLHAPAIFGACLRAGLACMVAPQMGGLGQTLAVHQRVDRAGAVGQQEREHLLADLQCFGQVGAAEQQVAVAPEQGQVGTAQILA